MASFDLFMALLDALPLAGSASRPYPQRRFCEGCPDLALGKRPVLHYPWGHDRASQQELTRAANRDKATGSAMLDNLGRRAPRERHTSRVLLTFQCPALQPHAKPLVQELFEVAGPGPRPTTHEFGRVSKKYPKSYAG